MRGERKGEMEKERGGEGKKGRGMYNIHVTVLTLHQY